MSESATQYYADRYLEDSSCILQEEDFISYYEGIIDDFGCEVTCEECQERLSDSSAYVADRKEAYVAWGYADDAELLERVVNEYVTKKALCNQICNTNISPCEYMRLTLEVDVSPGGQYEEFEGDITQHPEYCKYQFCVNHPEVAAFDKMLDTLDAYDAWPGAFLTP